MKNNKLTVLFDLDDTLIADFTDKFMPRYLEALSEWLNTVPAEYVVPGIYQATKEMMVKDKAAGTLQECFNWYFLMYRDYPKMNCFL